MVSPLVAGIGGKFFSLHVGALPLMGEVGALSGEDRSSSPKLDAVVAT